MVFLEYEPTAMSINDKSLLNKVVFITGASSGIGAALAREFANRGASLALIGRRTERLETLAAELKLLGVKALPVTCDVTKANDVKEAANDVENKLGQIDIVIANAGFGVIGRFDSLSVEDYKRQFNTNVYGVLNTIYATIDSLKRSRGRLVLMGSMASYISMPNTSAYTMSKFAIKALADTLFVELAPFGISVTLISTGFVKSEIRKVNNMGVYQDTANDPVPSWLRLPAEKAAKTMVNGIVRRKREQVVSLHARVALFFNWIFPGLLLRLFLLI